MAPALQTIELATLLPATPGPQLISDQGVEETWKADIYAESGPTVAYVKMLQPQQVISEVVCALTGIALGLNIPKPFLVYVDRANLDQSTKWNAKETWRICFGSEDEKHDSFKQVLMQKGATNALINQLLNWSSFKETAWFDEWTANIDRHGGNLLFDGANFWLIDHGHALTGPNWTPADLLPDKQVANKLLLPAYLATLKGTEKDKWKDVAGIESLKYQAIALETLRECGMLDDYASAEQRDAVVNFLAKRAETFMYLACDRLGIPRPLI